MHDSRSDDSGSEPNDASGIRTSRQAAVVERVSRYGIQVMPSAFQRRSRLQRQQEVCDSCTPHTEAPERCSLTPSMRKRYPKGSLPSSGLTSQTHSVSSSEQDVNWALNPMEHSWMLSAVEGNYETILEFILEDPYLLTRKDFVSGYSVLHWLAKRGQDETLFKLLQYAKNADIPVNVNLRGSGGLTPLHVASMHSRYPVIKLLVGAFGANVDVMDYNGKRAWQYLRENAPLEMKELLGTWDDEHNSGCALNKNSNNSATVVDLPVCDEVDGKSDEGNFFERTTRTGSWRFGSLRKLLPISFVRNKN